MPDLTTLAGAHEQIAILEIEGEHRTVIGQAIGILQERFDLDPSTRSLAGNTLSALEPGGPLLAVIRRG